MQEDTTNSTPRTRLHQLNQAAPATEVLVAALTEALQDEYKARATYAKVIEAFGPVRPFINIVEAESRHARALERQFERLEVPLPADEWAGQVEAPDSLDDAYKDAIASEIDNAAMYERLLEVVDDAAVYAVLLRLQDASQNRHLPAFQRRFERAGRGTGRGHGCGGGRGRGRKILSRRHGETCE